jgi:hypothetical protein
MDVVVDIGAARNPDEIVTFLRASSSNRVVLTHLFGVESHKGDFFGNSRANYSAFAAFPSQVVLLKEDQEIVRLSPRKRGIRGRLICWKRTKFFPQFLEERLSERPASPCPETAALISERIASYYENLLKHVEESRHSISQNVKIYDKDDLKAIRRGESWPIQIAIDIVGNTIREAEDILRAEGIVGSKLTYEELAYSFIFRYLLCVRVLDFDWISRGGHESVSAKRLCNDYIDANYAAYATFFDYLGTRDEKLKRVYINAQWLMRNIVFPGVAVEKSDPTKYG